MNFLCIKLGALKKERWVEIDGKELEDFNINRIQLECKIIESACKEVVKDRNSRYLLDIALSRLEAIAKYGEFKYDRVLGKVMMASMAVYDKMLYTILYTSSTEEVYFPIDRYLGFLKSLFNGTSISFDTLMVIHQFAYSHVSRLNFSELIKEIQNLLKSRDLKEDLLMPKIFKEVEDRSKNYKMLIEQGWGEARQCSAQDFANCDIEKVRRLCANATFRILICWINSDLPGPIPNMIGECTIDLINMGMAQCSTEKDKEVWNSLTQSALSKMLSYGNLEKK